MSIPPTGCGLEKRRAMSVGECVVRSRLACARRRRRAIRCGSRRRRARGRPTICDAAVEAFFVRDLGDARLSSASATRGRGAQHDARLADGLVQGVAQRRFDLGGRRGVDARRAASLRAAASASIDRFRAHRFDLARRSVRAHGAAPRWPASRSAATRFERAHFGRPCVPSMRALGAEAVDLVLREQFLLARARGVRGDVALGVETRCRR